MGAAIRFQFQKGAVEGELIESPFMGSLIGQLPLAGTANVWGKEIYFEIPEPLGHGELTKEMEVGDIAYWVEGQSLCIFFGPTPVSKSGRPEPYVPVFKIGRVRMGNSAMALLEGVEQGQKVLVESP